MFPFPLNSLSWSSGSDGSISLYIAAIDIYFRKRDDGLADEGGTLQGGQIFVIVSAI